MQQSLGGGEDAKGSSRICDSASDEARSEAYRAKSASLFALKELALNEELRPFSLSKTDLFYFY